MACSMPFINSSFHFSFMSRTFAKIYASQLVNRIRELNSSSDNELSRWIWELIQNAKDCTDERICLLHGEQKQNPEIRPVDIRIIHTWVGNREIVVFKHNGFPFNEDTLDSLMYRYSTKGGDNQGTGRFGTGFMTSHTLAKTVTIDAPFIDENKNLKRISPTVYREGRLEEEIIEDFIKMNESRRNIYDYDENNPEHQWTSFTYELTNDTARKSYYLGIQSFHNYIAKTLLFCPQIKSIQIDDEEPFRFTLLNEENCNNSIFKEPIRIESKKFTNGTKTYIFIVFSTQETNDEYSIKFAKDTGKKSIKQISYSIAFNVDSDLNPKLILDEQGKVHLFCTFPLIGSENFQLPFLLNSPNFEVLTERNGLILDGAPYDDYNILTNRGLNEIILSKSISLFKFALHWLVEENCSNFFILARNITNSFVFSKKFDPPIENKKSIAHIIKNILENEEIVTNSSNKKFKLGSIFFLNFNGVKNSKEFHRLTSQFYTNIASFEECENWKDVIWDSLHILSLENFIEHISCIGSNKSFMFSEKVLQRSNILRNIKSLTNEDYSFLSQFYAFLLQEEQFNLNNYTSKIWKYPIVLNSNSQFVLIHKLFSDKNFSKDLNKIMSFCQSWGCKLIHPKIDTFASILPLATFNDAQNEFNQFISINNKNTDLLLNLIKFIPDNNNQMTICRLAQKFLLNNNGQLATENVNNVDVSLYEKLNLSILKLIQENISKKIDNEINENELNDYNDFYDNYQKIVHNSDFLVPNFKLILKKKDDLKSISDNIPQIVLDSMSKFITFDCYAHPSIKSVKFIGVFDLNELINIANGLIQSNKNVLSCILSFFPPKENKRLYSILDKISKIAPFFLNLPINQVKTNIVDEKFWQKSISYVNDKIFQLLKSNKNIDRLSQSISKTNSEIYKNLNLYFALGMQINESRWKINTLIPNYFGDFKPAKDLSIISNVPDKYFELYNLINKGKDIKESFAHSEVKCEYLEVINLDKILKMMCQNVSDRQLSYDRNIQEGIFRFHPFDSLKSSKDNILLDKLYLSNINNKLNDMLKPNENDKRRWCWELIQIALDSLNVPSCNRNEVNVTFDIRYNNNQCTELIFSHDGPGFKENSLLELIFAISGKSKYGAGFASTHVLSQKIELSGNLYSHQKISGFSVILNREGKNDDSIVADFKRIKNSCQPGKEQSKLNSFKYEIQNQQNRENVELGLTHLEEYIYQVLINCSQLRSVHIIKNGNETVYSVQNPIQQTISNIVFNQYTVTKNNQSFQYIVMKNENKKINITIILDSNGNIVQRNKDSISLFTIFPLTGSQSHVLPFFLNSSELIPNTKYDSLILSGNCEEFNKNKSILMESTNLFYELIQKLNEKNCQNMHELSTGLLLSEKPYDSFDLNWYKNTFLIEMKNKLSNHIKVKTFSGNIVLLKDAIFPDDKIDNNKLDKFISLVFKCFNNNIVNKQQAELWKNKIWETVTIYKIDDLIKGVKSNQSLLDDPNLTFYNEFLNFIWDYDKTLLYKNKLIPDMKNELHCYPNPTENEKEDFRECKTVSNDIIEIMESINIKWKLTHMNNSIQSFRLSEDRQIDAQSRIIEKIKNEKTLCFVLMRFVLSNNQFRKNMYDIYNEFNKIEGNPVFDSFIEVRDVDPSIWNYADSFVLSDIEKKITKYDSEKVLGNLSFFQKFIQLFNGYFKKDDSIISSAKIVPNKLGHLKRINELYNMLPNLHDYLNNILKIYVKLDFDEQIIHPKINEIIKSNKTEKIADFLYKINNKLKNDHSQHNQFEIAISIISLVPKNDKKYNSLEKQNELFEFCNKFVEPKLNKILIDDDSFSNYDWETSNKIAIHHICRKIEESQTLQNFNDTILNKSDNSLEVLNSLYELTQKSYEYDKYKIVPNIKGEFYKREDLMQNPEIDIELINCIEYLDPKFLIQDIIIDKRVQIDSTKLKKFEILDFYQKLNKLFNNALEKNDDKAYEMIRKINGVDDSSFLDKVKKHDFTKEEQLRMDIFVDAHINFLKNYLRELDFKSPREMKKWPFELIQNANDTVHLGNKKVNIKFEFNEDKFIFKHDGEPFLNKHLLALLYQSSYGKDTKSTTGKFGTGFLSTMIVSKRIQLSGDLLDTNGQKKGFEVTLFRDAENSEDYKEGIREMEKSLKKDLPTKNETKFEYYLKYIDKNKKNIQTDAKVIELGIQSLKENISRVLIINPSIESITIITKSESLIYKLNSKSNVINMNDDDVFSIQTVLVEDKNHNPIEENKFLVINSNKKFSFQLNNQDFKNDVKIDCLVQIGKNNNIINISDEIDKDKEKEKEKIHCTNFFSSYPMFGNAEIRSPFIINSPNFEVDRERQFLLIHSKSNELQTKESLINQFIIDQSVILYRQMINQISNMEYTDLFNLFTCLKENIKNNEFIQEHFVVKIREFINDIPLFETKYGLKSANEIYIPYEDKYEDFSINKENEEEKNKIDEDFYDLTSQFEKLDSRVFVTHECAKQWKPLLWEDFPSFFKIDNFYGKLSLLNDCSDSNNNNNNNSSDLNNQNLLNGRFDIDSKIEYIKKVFNFLQKQKNYEGVLMRNAILINESGKLVTLNQLYQFEISCVVKSMLDTVNYDYKSQMLHQKLEFLRSKINFHKFTNETAFGQIQISFNETNAKEFMKYVIKSDQNREHMFEHTKLLLLPDIQKVEIDLINGELKMIPTNLYETADKLVCKLFTKNCDKKLEKIVPSKFIPLLKTHLSTREYENFDKEKFYHKKCITVVRDHLNSKYSNVSPRNENKIDFDPNRNDCNFEGIGKSDNHKYYFIVNQAEYFSFKKAKKLTRSLNSNEHYILSIVYDVDSDSPTVMTFELMK